MDETLRGRVAVVTGGGAGIGAASALELAHQGAVVIVMDPGVGVQGENVGETSAAATAERIKSQGGEASHSTLSVADRAAVEELFQQVKRDFGSLDIVVNAAGILRRSRLADTTEDDWRTVFDVHFNGYLNVLSAALPSMIEAGYGRVVGFTSGVGLSRVSLDQTAYGCAKRSVAALTWELGPLLPPGVNVNALSPIADTRMIRDALARRPSGRGLDLSAAPQAEDLAPVVAYLCGDRLDWCRGQVFASAGSELAVIGRPHLLEAVRTENVANFGTALASVVPAILQPSEANQRSGGGGIPRLGDVFGSSTDAPPHIGGAHESCLIVSDDRALATATGAAVRARGIKVISVGSWEPFDEGASIVPSGFEAAEQTLARAVALANIDAIILITADGDTLTNRPGPAWQTFLEDHRDVASRVINHAAWARAAARHAIASGHAMRMIHVNGAVTAAGRTVAQAVVQMSRSAIDTTMPVPLDAFSLSVEGPTPDENVAIGQLVGHLVGSDDGPTIKGAELVVGKGWVGLRSHPGPTTTATYGGPTVPLGIDDVLMNAF